MGLAVPLTHEQIAAAYQLHKHLDQWSLSDAALKRLRDTFPGFDIEACLLKTVAINSLYGTQVFAVVRMAQHVEAVLRETDIGTASTELVERIASLPKSSTSTFRRFISFAAKFSHFFVDENRFPIYDEGAREVIKMHLGEGYVIDPDQPYVAFCNNLKRLRTEAGLNCSSRELDRYLWITGMYMKWLREREKQTPQLNVELQSVFKNPNRDAAAALDALLPASLERAFKREA